MVIRLEWHDAEQEVQYMTFKGDWTEDDFTEAVRKSVSMSEAVGHPLYIISDMRESGNVPPSAITLARWSLQVNDRLQLLVLVTENTFILALNQAASRVYPRYWNKVAIARSPEEAMTLINRRRAYA